MKRLFAIAAPFAVVLLLFVLGPGIIRQIYATSTSSDYMNKKIEEYRLLDRQESSLSGDLLRQSQMKRMQIYYWLLARGRDIDGGDAERTLLSPWKDLMQYWRDDGGSPLSRN